MKIDSFLIATLAVALSGCAARPTKPTQAEPRRPLAPRTHVPSAAPESLVNAGHKYFQAKDYSKAYDYFIAATSRDPNSPKVADIQFWALRAAARSGKVSETLQLSDSLINAKAWPDSQKAEILSYKLRAHEAQGESMEALNTILLMLATPALAKDHDSLKARAKDLVQNRLGRNDLEKVAPSPDYGALRGAAYFKLGELSMDEKNTDQARSFFNRAASLSPGSDEALRAQEVLAQLDAIRRVEPKTIGVVLPMTGKYAGISQKTLRAVQMGLGLYGNNSSSFRLAIVDSEGNPDNARRGVESLVKDDNVIAIIGTVLSKTAPAVASKSTELGVPSIALSQKSGVTELGTAVFRNSLTSEMQVRYLVKTSMEDLGLRRFAVLYPNDQYGVEFANIFWDEVLARGGQITAAQTYSPKETDFGNVIQRLVGTYYLEARADEYKLKLKEWSNAQTKRSARNLPPDDLLPPIVDFDAIFIPDSAKTLGQISAMLAYNNVKGVRLLGTNLWNTPGIAKRAGASAANLVFVDSYVGTDPTFSNSYFVREYKNQFNEEPGIFELQAYDSALLLRQLISQGATGRESLTRALAQIKDFPGSLGPLTISADREIQRPLVALVLENGNVVPLARTTNK